MSNVSFANYLTFFTFFQEFKFNANAKSFVPFQTPRPSSPVADSSFYYPPMHGMPAGVGVNAHISFAT